MIDLLRQRLLSLTAPRGLNTSEHEISTILLNKSLARILIRYPTLNEHEPFYLM